MSNMGIGNLQSASVNDFACSGWKLSKKDDFRFRLRENTSHRPNRFRLFRESGHDDISSFVVAESMFEGPPARVNSTLWKGIIH